MSSNRRNVIVGLTVMVAMVILGGMLLKFGGPTIKLFHRGQQVEVQFTADRADGLAEGAQVTYLGLVVGRVTRVQRAPDDRSVVIDAEVDNTQPLPRNVEGVILINSPLGGSAVLSLELVGGPDAKPAKERLVDQQHMAARYVGSELIPPQFAALASELGVTAREVQKAQLVVHMDDSVRQAGQVMQSLQAYVNDPKLRADIQTSLDNFRHISETTSRSADKVETFANRLDKVADDAVGTVASARTEVDRVSKQLDERMQQAGKLLDTFQAISVKVNAGQGTAALLVNDPKLYQSLVDNSRSLNATILDLRRLVQQWEQEGASIKLR